MEHLQVANKNALKLRAIGAAVGPTSIVENAIIIGELCNGSLGKVVGEFQIIFVRRGAVEFD